MRSIAWEDMLVEPLVPTSCEGDQCAARRIRAGLGSEPRHFREVSAYEPEAKMATDSIDIECVDHVDHAGILGLDSYGLDPYMGWVPI